MTSEPPWALAFTTEKIRLTLTDLLMLIHETPVGPSYFNPIKLHAKLELRSYPLLSFLLQVREGRP